jgi:parallel beta-helix repeat protein
VRLRAVLFVSLLVGSAIAATTNVRAANAACGDSVTQSLTLDGDVGPCSGRGLSIDADNITLNLNGFRVFGFPDISGEGAGVRFNGVSGSTLKNGTVAGFDAGVHVNGGRGNTVKKVQVRDNIGGGLLGDGISVEGSSDNVIKKNQVVHNGPFGGITILGASSGNDIVSNLVIENNVKSAGPANEDIGIRIENSVTQTLISKNTVRGSGLEGISIFATATQNELVNNTVVSNGFHSQGHRKGDGIRVFGDDNLIKKNFAGGNAANGIGVNVTGGTNTLTGNRSFDNARQDATAFDLNDGSTDCDNNAWNRNTFDTKGRDCIE